MPDEGPPPREPRRSPESAAARPPPPVDSSPAPTAPVIPEPVEPPVDFAALKNVGLASIPFDVPPKWRTRVVDELQHYVTAKNFPSWAPSYEHHGMVRAKVDEVLQPFRDEQEREQARKQKDQEREQKRQQREQEKQDEERDRQSLISHAKRYARKRLEEIHPYDRYKTRRELEEILDDETEADWEKDDVEELVDEVISELLDDDSV